MAPSVLFMQMQSFGSRYHAAPVRHGAASTPLEKPRATINWDRRILSLVLVDTLGIVAKNGLSEIILCFLALKPGDLYTVQGDLLLTRSARSVPFQSSRNISTLPHRTWEGHLGRPFNIAMQDKTHCHIEQGTSDEVSDLQQTTADPDLDSPALVYNRIPHPEWKRALGRTGKLLRYTA